MQCGQRVNYANEMIKHVLIKGLTDQDIMRSVLGKTDDMDLEKTIAYVEAKESGKTSAGVLANGTTLVSDSISKMSAYRRSKKMPAKEMNKDVGKKNNSQPSPGKCGYCGGPRHSGTAKDRCPAYNKYLCKL